MDKDKALKLALEAQQIIAGLCADKVIDSKEEKILRAAIKQARSAQVQEPVHQWQQKHSPYWYDGYPDNDDGGGPYETRTLYTTPPAAQRQWVGLTAGERDALFTQHYQWDDYGKAIEAKLKKENT
jgi:hypothetical protein